MNDPNSGPGIYGPGYIGGGSLTSGPAAGFGDLNAARLGSPGALQGMIKGRVGEINDMSAGGAWGDQEKAAFARLFQQLVQMGYAPAHASKIVEQASGMSGLGMGRESGVVPYAGESDPFGPAINKPEMRASDPGMMQAMGKYLSGLFGGG